MATLFLVHPAHQQMEMKIEMEVKAEKRTFIEREIELLWKCWAGEERRGEMSTVCLCLSHTLSCVSSDSPPGILSDPLVSPWRGWPVPAAGWVRRSGPGTGGWEGWPGLPSVSWLPAPAPVCPGCREVS